MFGGVPKTRAPLTPEVYGRGSALFAATAAARGGRALSGTIGIPGPEGRSGRTRVETPSDTTKYFSVIKAVSGQWRRILLGRDHA